MSKKNARNKQVDIAKTIPYEEVAEFNTLIPLFKSLFTEKNVEAVLKAWENHEQSKNSEGETRIKIEQERFKIVLENQRNYRINFVRESVYNVIVLMIVLGASIVTGYLQLIEKNLTGYILVAIVTAFLTNAIRRKNPPIDK
ncbi:MAG: hypothetical protein IPG01_09260 [Chitinophagaceae bacterium]|nr:hypothetical protein [Chitinophagaceae bacterium]